MHKISVLDDWDMGEWGGKYAQCCGPYKKYPSSQKHYVLYFTGGGWDTANFNSFIDARNWIGRNCARCSQ
jgi:hypothetical protein